MLFEKQAISDVIVITPKIFGDERGFFTEAYKKELFYKNGIATDFVQDNMSSSKYGVIRGLHYQLNPRAQGKLVIRVAGQERQGGNG